jgi:hypothetical protein
MEPQNCGQYLMKKALKRKNDEFLVMPLKYVLSVMDLVNHYRTPKLWAIAHENSPKTTSFWLCLSNMYRVSWTLKWS